MPFAFRITTLASLFVASSAIVPSPPPSDKDHCCYYRNAQTTDGTGCDPCNQDCGDGWKCHVMDGEVCSNTGIWAQRPWAVCKNDPQSCCFESNDKNVGMVPCDGENWCPAKKSGGSGGDPHFKTWAGEWYDYHGICDLVLVHAKEFGKGLGLDIHIRTKERYGFSFIETAAIKIGDSLLEVSSFGEYWLNEVSQAELPHMMADLYEITHEQKNKKEHTFTIAIPSYKEKIVVKTFKDMVSINLEEATEASFGASMGLMGSFDDGRHLARDGVTVIATHNTFGQEWQVQEGVDEHLFQTTRAPQYPQKCVLPDPKKASRRRLGEGISVEAATLACSNWEGERKDMCIFDVLAMQDLDVANAHGVF